VATAGGLGPLRGSDCGLLSLTALALRLAEQVENFPANVRPVDNLGLQPCLVTLDRWQLFRTKGRADSIATIVKSFASRQNPLPSVVDRWKHPAIVGRLIISRLHVNPCLQFGPLDRVPTHDVIS
jgi:hypothetical protein